MVNIPQCIYDPILKRFQIINECGKSLSGGFGVAWNPHMCDNSPTQTNDPIISSNHYSADEGDNFGTIPITDESSVSNVNAVAAITCSSHPSQPTAGTHHTDPSATSTASSSTKTYLFIEEAVFLHERGLLQVCKYRDGNLYIMDTQDLYQLMLEDLQFPLAVYLTYSHLRSQTFIVLRHFPQRIALVRQIQEFHQHSSKATPSHTIPQRSKNISATTTQKEHDTIESSNDPARLLRRKARLELGPLHMTFRNESFYAPNPNVLSSEHDHLNQDSAHSMIAFHVYNPTSNYRKTNPGMPDFQVAVSYFNACPSIQFDTIYSLIQATEGIPFRMATVSDSGTVIMFGITDMGVPSLLSSKAL